MKNQNRATISRRQAIATAAVALTTTVVPLSLSIEAAEKIDVDNCTVNEWLGNMPSDKLANTAKIMAEFEGAGTRCERPRMWRTEVHMGGISWRPGVSMLYGFNGLEPLPPERNGIMQATEDAGFEILATGWSDDRRAWTIFVRADAGELGEALGVNLKNELSFCVSPGLRLFGSRLRIE